MTKSLITLALALLAAALMLQAFHPAGAAATPASEFAPAAPDLALPATREPFDMTPITPVESAGAAMYQ